MLNNYLLIQAVLREELNKVNSLLATQPDLILEKNEVGYTALHCAVLYADIGTNTQATQIFTAILTKAIALGQANTLLNLQSNIGSTPLTHALDKATTVNDVFAQRAVIMIQHGAILPDTAHAKRIFWKLTPELQQFIQQKLIANSQPAAARDTLSQYNGEQNNSSSSHSIGLRQRHVVHNNVRAIELKTIDNSSFRK